MMHRRLLLLALSCTAAMSLMGMETPMDRVRRITDQNETQYNETDCRPFVTLTATNGSLDFIPLLII